MHNSTIEEHNLYLVDEALASEPIKNTFRLSREFIILNRQFTITAIVMFIVLNLLGTIPVLALFFMVFAGVFGLIIQIHVGQTFYKSDSIQTYITSIKESRIDTLLTKHIAPAFGAYLGWIVLFLIFIFSFGFLAGSMGLISDTMTENDLVNLLTTVGIPFLLFAMVLSYVQPLVQANIIASKSFGEGFKAVFTLFSIDVWRSSFNMPYFKYVAIFGTVVVGILFVAVAIVTAIGSLIGLSLIGNILLLVVMYMVMVLMAVGSMMAKRLVE